MIGGDEGALELPNLRVWKHAGLKSWWAPITTWTPPVEHDDPLMRQVRQFAAVIRGREPPLVSGRDGLEALRVIESVKRSAESGATVSLTSADSPEQDPCGRQGPKG